MKRLDHVVSDIKILAIVCQTEMKFGYVWYYFLVTCLEIWLYFNRFVRIFLHKVELYAECSQEYVVISQLFMRRFK